MIALLRRLDFQQTKETSTSIDRHSQSTVSTHHFIESNVLLQPSAMLLAAIRELCICNEKGYVFWEKL